MNGIQLRESNLFESHFVRFLRSKANMLNLDWFYELQNESKSTREFGYHNDFLFLFLVTEVTCTNWGLVFCT